MLRTLHLFAGAGGGLLSDLILGHEPVCAVEWDKYCCQILRERVAGGWFPGMHVYEGDVRMFNASEWKGRVDCIHAGFPCPPFSVAGKRKGAMDERNMWPATVRVIGEIRPRLVFLENVAGFVSSGYGWTVLSDLSRLGYDCRWTLLGADQVGAPHRRERWWCLAYPRRRDGSGNPSGMGTEKAKRYSSNVFVESGGAGQDVADASGFYAQRFIYGQSEVKSWRSGWWETEPTVGRVVDGMAYRVDRLKALGNGQVPLQAAAAFRILSGGLT